MKKVQTAIGEWHDWDSLARVVSRGKYGKYKHLVELLDTLSAEAFEAAVAVCLSIRAQLAGSNGADAGAVSSASGRKPPARNENGIVRSKLA
jgi:hypothetical protein